MGRRSVAKAIDECDLLIALGTRFSDRVALSGKDFAHEASASILTLTTQKSVKTYGFRSDSGRMGDVPAITSWTALLKKERTQVAYRKTAYRN